MFFSQNNQCNIIVFFRDKLYSEEKLLKELKNFTVVAVKQAWVLNGKQNLDTNIVAVRLGDVFPKITLTRKNVVQQESPMFNRG